MRRCAVFVFAIAVAAAQSRDASRLGRARIDLAQGWAIRSSADVSQTGDLLSSAGFDASAWYPATVPSTVISALANDGVYADPYYGYNLRSIPGTTYPFGDNFAQDPMPPDSPFAVSWWFRTEFRLPAEGAAGARGPKERFWLPGRRLWLNFDSINYRANIWLNGRKIAGSDQVLGMYRSFEFDITGAAVPGVNTLAVEVFAPTDHDLSISFVDWNPLPADKDMGLVRDVYILTSGPVDMRNVQVVSQLNGTFDRAQLTLSADLNNAGAQPVAGTLKAVIGSVMVSAPVTLAAGAYTRITLDNPAVSAARHRQPAPLVAQRPGTAKHVPASPGIRCGRGRVRQPGRAVRYPPGHLGVNERRAIAFSRINGQKILIRGGAGRPT